MGYVDLDSLDHDAELAAALGNMVVAWARAEVALTNIFACSISQHINQATAVFARLPTFETKVKVTRASLSEWHTKQYDRDAIDAAIEKLSGLAGTRNNWVHNTWCRNDQEPRDTVVFNFRAPEGDGRRKPVKAHDVLDHVRAVRERTKVLLAAVPFPYRGSPVKTIAS